MPRTPARVTQADIARALRAAQQVGSPMAVKVRPDGTIEIVPVMPASGGDSGEKRQQPVDVRERPVL